ncbi:MAG: hypothetical protein AMXMBFR84_20770 [Candidatus Hydrogenedentota bacterium]
MPNTLKIGILVVGALAQLAVPVWMIAGKERTLREGLPFKFRTAPVDPADVFRGRYVALAFEAQTAPVPEGMVLGYDDVVYAVVEADEDGFAKIASLALTPPSVPNHMKIRVSYVNYDEKTVQLIFPFDRFYMEESFAPAAEQAYFANRNMRGEPAKTYALVRILNGDSTIENLYIDDIPIRDFVLQQEIPQP